MRAFLVLLLVPFIILPVLVVWGAFIAIEHEPRVVRSWQPQPSDIARARAVLKAHDPRGLPAGVERRVSISERDLNLAANHALNLVGPASVSADMRRDVLEFVATVELPANPFGRYLNLEITLRTDGPGAAAPGFPQLTRLRIGALSVPRPIADFLFVQVLDRIYSDEGVDLDARDVITGVVIGESEMQMTYRIPQGALARLQTALVHQDERERLEVYHAALVVELRRHASSPVALTRVLAPLFALAEQRSRESDAPAENRSLLIVSAAFTSGRGLRALVPESRTWSKPPRVALTLRGRRDFAQHFLASAALAAVGGSQISDAIGLFKEVEDSRVGSGFSFPDLAADRAGVRFGSVAVRSVADAARLQALMRTAPTEAELMPDARDLPEGLSAAEFDRRFGGLDSPAYRVMVGEIERRLDALTLYQ
jgi:uncharacterized protein YfiM (DUF2279 family)